MRIIKVEAIPLSLPRERNVNLQCHSEDSDRSLGTNAGGLRSLVGRNVCGKTVVKIVTDTGHVGWGEALSAATATMITEGIADMLVGADPTNPAFQWERMYGMQWQSTGSWREAISGIDIALWDLAGKTLGVSISTLLGGYFRHRVKVCASGISGVGHASDADLCDVLEAVRQQGFQAVKVAGGHGVNADIRAMEIVRNILGPDFLIIADARGVYDISEAIRLGRALKQLGGCWLEAPLPPENVAGYARLARALDISIASIPVYNRWQVRDLLCAGAIDIVQMDVCRSGGFTECKRIAELADAFGKAVMLHVHTGSVIHFGASIHLAAALPNQTFLEIEYTNNLPFCMEDGFFRVLEKPGLGIDEHVFPRSVSYAG